MHSTFDSIQLVGFMMSGVCMSYETDRELDLTSHCQIRDIPLICSLKMLESLKWRPALKHVGFLLNIGSVFLIIIVSLLIDFNRHEFF